MLAIQPLGITRLIEVTKCLLAYGADIGACEERGTSVIAMAKSRGNDHDFVTDLADRMKANPWMAGHWKVGNWNPASDAVKSAA